MRDDWSALGTDGGGVASNVAGHGSCGLTRPGYCPGDHQTAGPGQDSTRPRAGRQADRPDARARVGPTTRLPVALARGARLGSHARSGRVRAGHSCAGCGRSRSSRGARVATPDRRRWAGLVGVRRAGLDRLDHERAPRLIRAPHGARWCISASSACGLSPRAALRSEPSLCAKATGTTAPQLPCPPGDRR